MGLFDEAIRDHLELKRRHGADLQEIARIERDALRRADGVAEIEPDFESRGRELPFDGEHEHADVDAPDGPEASSNGAGVAYGDRSAQETTEIDIAARTVGVRSGSHEEAYDREREAEWAATGARSDDFEWEMPRSAGR